METNLTCKKVIELISSFIDGELSEEEQNAMKAHFESCSDCASELEMIQAISKKVQATFEAEELNIPDFSASIAEHLNAEKLTCEKVSENLSAYFDGELETAEYYELKNHIDECSQCKEQYEKLEYLRNLIKLSVNSLDLDLWSKVYNRLIEPTELECGFVSDKLSEYLDKELDEKLYKSISEHILSCPVCRKEFDDLKLVQKHIKKALLEPSKDVNLWPGVYYKLTRSSHKKTFAYSSVASLAMVVFVWMLLSVMFPVDNIELSDEDSKLSTSSPKTEAAYTVASNDSTADSYFFNSALSTPPSGVIPIMYQGDGYDY